MEVTICAQDGTQRREAVEAVQVAPGFFVNASLSVPGGWTLTHAASGGALGYLKPGRCKTRRGAARCFAPLVAVLPEGAATMEGRDLARLLAETPESMAVLRQFRY